MTIMDKVMRVLFFAAFIVDVALGLICVFFAQEVQIILNVGREEEPAFIRILGLFPIFVGYPYYLIFCDQRKYLVLIQVTVLERLSYPILLSAEIFYLLPGPFSLIHLVFSAMALITLFLALMQVYYLIQLNQKVILSG